MIPEGTANEKILKSSMKSNKSSMDYLRLSVRSAKDTVFLVNACYEDRPKGLAHVAWKKFHKKYVKTDVFWLKNLGKSCTH